ncbi:MAG TPA: hypothetical protein VHM91_20125 [Verrucomicrobiales bacterium]|jgi:hypothetical protein|nr:hypothetical protein [Verrucomicrobiales bacterium]
MSARTYVCVTCRWARRAEAAYGLNTRLRCPACHASLWELEWHWRIPRKTDDDGWRDLASKVARDSAVQVPARQRTGTARVIKLDKQILGLERQPDSARKTARLKKLRNDRARTIQRYL